MSRATGIRRQDHQADIVGHVEVAGSMPAGAVHDHQRVFVDGTRGAETCEKGIHDFSRDLRHDEAEILAGRWLDGGQHVHPGVALVAQARRPLAARPPAMTGAPLLADAGLVLEPERQTLVWMSSAGRIDRRLKPPFLKAS